MAAKFLSFGHCQLDNDVKEDRVVKLNLTLNEVHSLINKELDFFKQFNISTNFLNSDHDTWNEDADFIKGQRIVKSLRVVNDTAERGVKLINDFNASLTKDEEQKQYLLQVVAECRKIFPEATKSALSKPFPPNNFKFPDVLISHIENTIIFKIKMFNS